MINKLSNRLADILLSNGTIKDEEHELYVYGLFMLLSQLMFFILICIFGLVLHCITESIIFYIAFQFIRKYAGGYHAKTEARCEIISTLSLLACIIIIRLSKAYDFSSILLITATLSAACIFAFCPLDTPEKPLSKKEYAYFRRISIIILLVIFILAAASFYFRLSFACAPLCMSLILEGILLTAGKAKRVILKRSSIKNKI